MQACYGLAFWLVSLVRPPLAFGLALSAQAAQHGSPHLHGVVAAEDCRGEGPAKDDKLWVILTQLDSLGVCTGDGHRRCACCVLRV